MNKAIITLSFDDGRKDNFNIANVVLNLRNIPATFNITTAFIEQEFDMRDIPLSKEELARIYQNPLFEIAAHGNMHKNDMNDISLGRKKLLEWLKLPEDELIGFASPGSGMDLEYIKNHEKELKKLGFSYIRTGPRWITMKKIRILARKVSRLIHNPFIYKIAYYDTLMDSTDGISVVSIPVLNDIKVSQLVKLIDVAKKENRWCVFMFHSIKKRNEESYNDTWSWDYDKFVEFVDILQQKRDRKEIQILTTKDAFELLNKGI